MRAGVNTAALPSPFMSESSPDSQNPAAEPAGQVTRRLRLEHREEQLARSYANAFRTYTSPEEVVVDLGFNLLQMNAASVADPDTDSDGTVTLDWMHRSVMSYRTAKSLAMDLARVIREYERVNGVIPVQGAAREGQAATESGGNS